MKDFIARNNLNPEKIPVGNVGYYIHKHGHKWMVRYGIVAHHYHNCVVLKLLQIPDFRTIDGVPISEIQFPTRWRKLPKGWTYDTKLFVVGEDETRKAKFSGMTIDLKDPESILAAYNAGMLVEKDYFSNAYPEEEIDKEHGWRIALRSDDKYESPYISVLPHNLYSAYDEVKAVIDAHDAEFKRISELSDYDWSVEQIDLVLDRWGGIYSKTDLEKQRAREWLLSQDRVEDIEVRLSGGNIEWKYWKNKRWLKIEC